MIKIYVYVPGTFARNTYTYPENWTFEDAKKDFTSKYRNELLISDSVMYCKSLSETLQDLNQGLELEDTDDIDKMIRNLEFIKKISWKGPGYYSVYGDPLLMDNEILDTVYKDNCITYLKEVSE